MKLAQLPRVPCPTIEVPDADHGGVLNQLSEATIVTGRGLQEGARPCPELRQAQILILDRNLCNAALLETKAGDAVGGYAYAADVLGLHEHDAFAIWDELVARSPEPMSEYLICSGMFEGGKTCCSGDSGGPLVVRLNDGRYIQAGLVSWGLSASTGSECNELALFSAHADVSKFVLWLNRVIAAKP